MNDDNLYPLDGAPFVSPIPAEPLEQKEERAAERGKALAALPMLEGIIDRFQEKIAFYDSVSSIPAEVKTDPTKFLIMHNANELTMNNLIAELDWLEGLVDDIKR